MRADSPSDPHYQKKKGKKQQQKDITSSTMISEINMTASEIWVVKRFVLKLMFVES